MDNNSFGGDWTNQKIEIISSYTQAYLTIMAKYKFKLIYFDGFAGSGEIETLNEKLIEGAAMRILDIESPRSFDIYYFVELIQKYADNLRGKINAKYGNSKKYYVECADFNLKLEEMVRFLKRPENRFYKALAFVDPKGMQVKWSSIERLKGLGIDMWILVPIGMGVNRLLTKDGDITEDWIEKLEVFLGMSQDAIRKQFYQTPQQDLFGTVINRKKKKTIDIAANLYQDKLRTVFTHVSNPFVMRNSMNSPMYHFFLATNNQAALNIANDVLKKYI
jgi:three-Cys-motif partner protein